MQTINTHLLHNQMEKNKFNVVCKTGNNNVAAVYLSGYITDWNNSANMILSAIDQAAAIADEIELHILNCYGGNVFEGLPICTKISTHPKITKTVTNGLAASMGAIIAMSHKNREIVKRSRLMFHKPKAEVYGEAQDLRDKADLLDSVEKDLAELLAKACNKTVEFVTQKYLKPFRDTYVTSSEANAEGIATEVEGEIKEDAPEDVLKNSDIGAIAAYYQKQITNSTQQTLNNNDMIKDLICAALGIDKSTADADVVAKVQQLINDKKTADDKVIAAEASAKKAKAEALVNAAKDAGKIQEGQVDAYVAIAIEKYEDTKTILDAMNPHQSIVAQLNGKKDAPDNSVVGAAKEGESDAQCYERLWKANQLENVKKLNPTRFEALRKAYAEAHN